MATSYYVPRPASLQLAQLAKFAQVATWYPNDKHPEGGVWFVATVAEVDPPEELGLKPGEEEAEPGTFWLLLKYPAQKGEEEDKEDQEWDQVCLLQSSS
jgi:hypothetical protein